MEKNAGKLPRISRKKKIWAGVIVGLAVVGLGWWAAVNFMPHPLGDKMTYLGKEDYGNLLGLDYRPSSVYYYGTDMSSEEMAEYFPKATYEPQKHSSFAQFVTPKGSFTFLYRKDDSFTTDKKYMVSLSASQYQRARDSL